MQTNPVSNIPKKSAPINFQKQENKKYRETYKKHNHTLFNFSKWNNNQIDTEVNLYW